MTKQLIAITGPSGAGKTSLINRLFESKQYLRSVTTRPPRPNEIDGKDYWFASQSEFDELSNQDEFVSQATYNGHSYGMLKSEITDKLITNDRVVVALVYDVLEQYRNFCQQENIEFISVFTNISKAQLLLNFESRDENDDLKKQRIAKYEKEIQNIKYFDDDHILDCSNNDFGQSASYKLKKLMNGDL